MASPLQDLIFPAAREMRNSASGSCIVPVTGATSAASRDETGSIPEDNASAHVHHVTQPQN